MRLFIAEKPNVGTSIAAQLGVKERKDGYLVTKTGDLVTWCFGHLMELAEPVKVHDVVFYVYQFRAPVSFLFRAFENFNLAPRPLYDITHPAASSHV